MSDLKKNMRDEVIRRNMDFVYGRPTSNPTFIQDPDKYQYIGGGKQASQQVEIINELVEGEYKSLGPQYRCDVYLHDISRALYSNGVNISELHPKATITSVPFPSFEHALLASKFIGVEERQKIQLTPDIKLVKRFISKEAQHMVRTDWSDKCLTIAESLLRDKVVRHKEVKMALLKTDDKKIMFQNNYNDLFWGCDKNKVGQNHLGKLLMKIRLDVKKGEDIDGWTDSVFDYVHPSKCRIYLKVTKGQESDDNKVFDQRNKLFIGKADISDVIANHPSISRTHAVIVCDVTRGPCLVDLGSSNGTFLNRHRVSPYTIVMLNGIDKIQVQLGTSTREYDLKFDLEADVTRKNELLKKVVESDVTASDPSLQEENTVFVRNIPSAASEDDLRQFFDPCGKIVKLNFQRNRTSVEGSQSLHRGIATVTFESFAGVIQAISRDGDELMGQNVRIRRNDAKQSMKVQDSKPSQPSQSKSYGLQQSMKEDTVHPRNTRKDTDRREGKMYAQEMEIKELKRRKEDLIQQQKRELHSIRPSDRRYDQELGGGERRVKRGERDTDPSSVVEASESGNSSSSSGMKEGLDDRRMERSVDSDGVDDGSVSSDESVPRRKRTRDRADC